MKSFEKYILLLSFVCMPTQARVDLIYHCQLKYLVCSSLEQFVDCAPTSELQSCLIIKKFETKTQCESLQQELVSTKYLGIECIY